VLTFIFLTRFAPGGSFLTTDDGRAAVTDWPRRRRIPAILTRTATLAYHPATRMAVEEALSEGRRARYRRD